MSLRIRQTTNDGRQKSWKISDDAVQKTFGSSRKAELNSIDAELQSFEGVIERSGQSWRFINFSTTDVPAVQKIENGLEVKFPHSKLRFEIDERNKNTLVDLKSVVFPSGPIHKIMTIVSNNNKIVETKLLNSNSNFNMMINGKNQSVQLNATNEWQQIKLAHFDIDFKSVFVNENADLLKNEILTADEIKRQKPQIIGAIVVLSLILVSIFFAEKSNTLPEKKTVVNSTNIVLKTPLQKKQKSKTVSSRTAELKNDNSGSSGNKASAAVKAAVGARISQLLGKVSATEARTANVLVAAQGVKAGEAPSGRALAALGKVESSGRNWNGEAVGKGTGVSTAGYGGGKGSAQFGGGLGQGRTGSGGVGLIEEESEIVGGLDREVIAQYIKTQLGQILYCYERQLSASPELYGKIAVKFTIAGTGQVETQAINDTTLRNKSVENCVLSKVAKWKFPEPKGGTKVVVTYPFLFKSTN